MIGYKQYMEIAQQSARDHKACKTSVHLKTQGTRQGNSQKSGEKVTMCEYAYKLPKILSIGCGV